MKAKYWGVILASLLLSATALAPMAVAQSYSGRAFGAFVNVPPLAAVTVVDTGNLPSTGGSLSNSLLNVVVDSDLTAQSMAVQTSGVGGTATSSAQTAGLVLLSGTPAMLTASVVNSQATASCTGASGSSVLTDLVFGGVAVTVTGAPNQTVTIPGVATLIINEQTVSNTTTSHDITVNALDLTLAGGGQIIVSSSHADVTGCAVGVDRSTWSQVKRIYS